MKEFTTPCPEEIFTPGGVPSVTYVRRTHLQLEARLNLGLDRPHSFTVVSGPTKTGKSVLCRRVLSERGIVVEIHGGQIRSIDDFWAHVAYKLSLPNSASKARTRSFTLTNLIDAIIGLPALVQAKFSMSSASGSQETLTANYTNIPTIASIQTLRARNAVLVLEDFHYLDRDIQRAILRSLKNAVFDGLKVIILAVPHRAFDPLEVEAELAGRVELVELPNWAPEDLAEIASLGFAALGLDIPSHVQRRISDDAFGNPLLVQDLCLALSRCALGTSAGTEISAGELGAVYDDLIQRRGMLRYDRLGQGSAGVNGAGTRVLMKEGVIEELAPAILRAVARLGPKPTTTLGEIQASLEAIAQELPAVAAVELCLIAISNEATRGGAPPLEWVTSRQVLEISDPYLMFYLRWILKDRRTLRLQGRAIDRLVGVVQATSTQPDTDHSL